MKLIGLYSYPLKSGKASSRVSVAIKSTGILHDRSLIVIDENKKAITGRELPELTTIMVRIENDMLTLSKSGRDSIVTSLPLENQNTISFRLFGNRVQGLRCEQSASDWMSAALGHSCTLVAIGTNHRPVDPKNEGALGDTFGYADASPIHLITKASLAVLNATLEKKVTPLHFRPNFVVAGAEAFEEDRWKTLTINGCQFEVHQKCKRCIFTTIDPYTAIKDEQVEPLSTLANFRKERNEDVTFGVYLIPRTTGDVAIGNDVKAKTNEEHSKFR